MKYSSTVSVIHDKDGKALGTQTDIQMPYHQTKYGVFSFTDLILEDCGYINDRFYPPITTPLGLRLQKAKGQK